MGISLAFGGDGFSDLSIPFLKTRRLYFLTLLVVKHVCKRFTESLPHGNELITGQMITTLRHTSPNSEEQPNVVVNE